MDIGKIEKDFQQMIQERGIHKKLGLESSNIRAYRQYLKNGQPISLELKIKLLQKVGYGVNTEEKEFTKADMQDLIKWYNAQGTRYDPDWAVHKYLIQKGQNLPAEHINDFVIEKLKTFENKNLCTNLMDPAK